MRRCILAVVVLGLVGCGGSGNASTTATPAPTNVFASPTAWAASDGVPMYRGNPARTGVLPGPGPVGDPVLLWQVHTQGPIVGSAAAIAHGIVYIGSEDGRCMPSTPPPARNAGRS